MTVKVFYFTIGIKKILETQPTGINWHFFFSFTDFFRKKNCARLFTDFVPTPKKKALLLVLDRTRTIDESNHPGHFSDVQYPSGKSGKSWIQQNMPTN